MVAVRHYPVINLLLDIATPSTLSAMISQYAIAFCLLRRGLAVEKLASTNAINIYLLVVELVMHTATVVDLSQQQYSTHPSIIHQDAILTIVSLLLCSSGVPW